MGWLWTFQLILDAAILWWLWKRLTGRFGSGDVAEGLSETSLRREDFERYHEALSDLCDRLRREGEGWVNRLEQKTRAARQVLERLEARGRIRDRANDHAIEERRHAPVVLVPDEGRTLVGNVVLELSLIHI